MMRPRTKALVGRTDGAGRCAIEFLDRGFTLELDGVEFPDLWDIVVLMDGSRTFGEVAALSGTDEASVIEFYARLEEHGLATLAPRMRPDALVDTGEFARAIEGATGLWRSCIFKRPLFAALLDEQGPPGLLTGLLTETFFYVGAAEGAIELPLRTHADAICPEVREALIAERGHQPLIAGCLESLGEQAPSGDRRPLLSTTNLESFLRSEANRDLSAFLGLFLISEMRPEDREGGEDFVNRLERRFALRTGTLAPLGEHAAIDLDQQHSNLLVRHLTWRGGPLPYRDASRIINACHDYKHLLDAWYDDILTTYGARSHRPGRRVELDDVR